MFLACEKMNPPSNRTSQNQSQVKTQTPPPITQTTVMYNVAVDDQPTGPYDIVSLRKMVTTGELIKDTLVWTTGMDNWEKAGNVDELKQLFNQTPPPIPKVE